MINVKNLSREQLETIANTVLSLDNLKPLVAAAMKEVGKRKIIKSKLIGIKEIQ